MSNATIQAPGPTLQEIQRELEFIQKYPWFEERPATLSEFLGPRYLNIADRVRPRIREELVRIIGEEVDGLHMTKYPLAEVTGAIGIGKTTVASIVLPYMAHWVLCLKDPQDFFDLLPGSRIAFMQMSTSESQALQVVFGDIKARIQHSPWFKKYPFNPSYKKQIRFDQKDIWILPGDSAETTFEGYNILGGILDEMDSHLVTEKKDYAEQGYSTIASRIDSRFALAKAQGFLLLIGQMKSSTGFAARKFKEFTERDDAYAVRLSIWESFGWDRYLDPKTGERDSFFYDTFRKQMVPKALASVVDNEHLIEVPTSYKKAFEAGPEKALRDLAGIPPAVGDPFIGLPYKIVEARDRWLQHHPGFTSPVRTDGVIENWFHAQESLPRVVHLDLAYSANGDALGLAMGHVSEVMEIDGEHKPYIVIDFLLRMKAPAGGEIFLGDVRRVIYSMRNDLGFRIKKATMDGFESHDTMQQFIRRRIECEYVSVDKQVLPYHDLREALYEDRIEFPQYLVKMQYGDLELTEVVVKELTELVDNGRKIDHPDLGSKDVADAIAGVTYTLMGDRSYRRKVPRLDSYRDQQDDQLSVVNGSPLFHPAMRSTGGLRSPVPPQMPMPGAWK